MYEIFSTLLFCLGFLSCGITAAPPTLFPRNVTAASLNSSFLELELGKSLSDKAVLYFPAESEFTNLTARWAENITPDFVVSVEVGTEEDVATTVSSQQFHTWSDLMSLYGYAGQICQEV